jgi:hypothetical protein
LSIKHAVNDPTKTHTEQNWAGFTAALHTPITLRPYMTSPTEKSHLPVTAGRALLNVFIHSFDSPSQAQYDLVHACRLLIRNSPIKWTPHHHVKGHQDNDTAYAELDCWGQLNVNMDNLAKQHWQHVNQEQQRYFSRPPTTEWSLWRNTTRITTWSETSGLELIYQKPSQSYWKKK